MVVDRWLGYATTGLLFISKRTKAVSIHFCPISFESVEPMMGATKLTLLAMHSWRARAESLQAPILLRSFEEAQQANMVANSAAQGAAAASFFGLTLSLFNFILTPLMVRRNGGQHSKRYVIRRKGGVAIKFPCSRFVSAGKQIEDGHEGCI